MAYVAFVFFSSIISCGTVMLSTTCMYMCELSIILVAFDFLELHGVGVPMGSTITAAIIIPLFYALMAYVLGVKHMTASIRLAQLLSLGYGLVFVRVIIIIIIMYRVR